jgi:hypothetical protein
LIFPTAISCPVISGFTLSGELVRISSENGSSCQSGGLNQGKKPEQSVEDKIWIFLRKLINYLFQKEFEHA